MISVVIANTVGIYNELKLYLITIFMKILFDTDLVAILI